VIIRPLVLDDAEAVLELRIANKEFFAASDPDWPDDFFTIEAQRARIDNPERPHQWLILDEGEPAGFVGLSNTAFGPFKSSILSYWVAQDQNGRGLASQAVAAVIEKAFGEIGLHRLEAGTLVDNHASQRVLERNGFERIGIARRYLWINGDWRDHILFQRIAD